ncbi:zinc finger protein 37 isoform X3 [Folsomia candida]|uniref:zinc finger protein 37 isoform X3 n=1 Tax=Folsomia candida TaxID=158441 RepID=UPI001605546B|nr:zinc finger protein 37 isoform X3 [Folsomia candida]
MADNHLCLLCLQVFNNCDDDDDDDTVAKSYQRIRIETLFELLSPFHSNHKSVTNQYEFAEDKVCEFCQDCYPFVATVEEIRKQISLLEEELGRKVGQIRTTILHPSSFPQNSDDYEIMKIRDKILVLTEIENAEEYNVNFQFDEVQVKVEDEKDNADPVGHVDDQFFDEDCNSFFQSIANEAESDSLRGAENEDDDFCITPSPQKKPRGRPKSTGNKAPPRTKRKSEELVEFNPISNSKRNKLNPGGSLSRPAAVRASPRIRKPISSVQAVKSLSKSLTRIKHSITKSSPISNAGSDDDAKSELGGTEWTPKNDPDIESSSSEDQVEHKNDPIRSHACSSCVRTFTSESALNRHIGSYHPVSCIVATCSVKFRTIKARDVHLKQTHEGFVPYQCRICKKKCCSQSTLEVHMVIRHEKGEKKFPCVKCDKSFCLGENLTRHLRLHKVEAIRPFVCDVCDSRFKVEERLQRHLVTHAKSFKCDYCTKRFSTTMALKKFLYSRHERSHTKEKPEKCPKCDSTFGDNITLQRHIVRDHSSASVPHICHICGKGFYLPNDLKMHLARHDGKLRVKCDTCGESFGEQSTLQSHRIKVHGDDPLVCDECGGTFTSRPGLQLHKKIHKGDKKHRCNICDATFIRKQELDTHMRSHTGERPFVCPHCEKAFKTRRNLSTHVKGIHTPGYVAPTPHKCFHCNKGFQTPFFLRCHIRQAHTGERPFPCDQCEKRFAIKSALNLHLKGAHGVLLEAKVRLARSKKDAFPEEDDA